MSDKDVLIKARDYFKSISEEYDNLIKLSDREEAGEDIQREAEATAGRIFIKLLEVQELSK